jgi:hypothetical protein
VIEGYRWLPVERRVGEALERAFAIWLRTPHVAGQQAPKMGVDCVQLLPGVLCPLYGLPKIIVPRQAQDAGIHSPRISMTTVRFLRRHFPSDTVRDKSIQPGDIVGTRASYDKDGPARLGHALIAGTHPWTALHAGKSGVGITSLLAIPGIVRIYRPIDKRLWREFAC